MGLVTVVNERQGALQSISMHQARQKDEGKAVGGLDRCGMKRALTFENLRMPPTNGTPSKTGGVRPGR